MKYLLDTGTVFALLKGESVVVTRLDIASKQAVFVPQPVWADLAYGLERLPPSNRKTLLDRCRLIRGELASAVWTDQVSERFGGIKAELDRRRTPMGDHEVAVAAHALAMGATLVTSDERMSRVPGLVVEDWGSET